MATKQNFKLLWIQAILLIFIALSACKRENEKPPERETILDKISHVEDSIHLRIDSISSLDDVLKMNGQLVDIGDCKLYYETEGNGTPMVVINGGPGGTHQYFHPWFSEAAKYCQVIYYDQRGCGKSDFNPGKNGYSFEQAIDDLDKLRRQLGIEEWVVCGYSYGGAVAQFYTATHPENTIATVYIGAKPIIKNEALNGTRQYDFISKEEKQKLTEIKKLYKEKKISLQQLFYNKLLNGDWKRQHYYKPTKEQITRTALYEWVNDDGFNASISSSLNKYDLSHVFDECPIPTLLCEGKWDLTWKDEKKEAIQQYLPKAKFVLFENSGHNIFDEEPELFFLTLKKFLSQLKPASDKELSEWKIEADRIIHAQQDLFKREAAFLNFTRLEGIKAGIEYFNTYKSENPDKKLFTETGMNALGYSYFGNKDYDTAIQLLEMNAAEYPNSWNVYDSLGEAYLATGNKGKAAENYKKSVELNPDNENGKKVLEELKT